MINYIFFLHVFLFLPPSQAEAIAVIWADLGQGTVAAKVRAWPALLRNSGGQCTWRPVRQRGQRLDPTEP